MDKKIKLGVIGIGNMGSAHAKHVAEGACPDFELVAVADTNPDRLQWSKEHLGENVQTFSTYEEMLDSGLIEACIVAVPHYDHPACAIACMQRNIHVLVEKPAGVYTKQVQEMNAEGEHLDIEEFEISEPEFSRTSTEAFGVIPSKKVEVETDGKNEMHVGVINAWGGAILRGEPMIADGREGINGLTISNAMHLSSWLDKTIELPFDEELYYNELMKRVATSRKKDVVNAVFADTSATYGGTADGAYKDRWKTNW